LPVSETFAPAEQSEVAALVSRAAAAGAAIYPFGGGTSLDYGLPGSRPGYGLSTAGLNRVVDYPARDLTITVEAGLTMSALQRALAHQGQCLPVDAAQADRATIGGVIATNTSGPRRYGHGTMRDYVIGITAVDGQGTLFHGGGRVVKNVAGYDFCKLLTGSLGTLAVITQVTLKVKPLPQALAFVGCGLPNWRVAEELLSDLVRSRTAPSAIELLAGPAWQGDEALPGKQGVGRLLVGLEGTRDEIRYMVDQLHREWRQRCLELEQVSDQQVGPLWQRLVEFSAAGAAAGVPGGATASLATIASPAQSGFVIKANLLPGSTAGLVELLQKVDAASSIQAHAGNGIVIARLSLTSASDLSKLLLNTLLPAAHWARGNVVVLSCPDPAELTRQVMWGMAEESAPMMRAVKQRFDPQGVLNPGRFVY
jgi:glycolate oxidase FAD binding subunit